MPNPNELEMVTEETPDEILCVSQSELIERPPTPAATTPAPATLNPSPIVLGVIGALEVVLRQAKAEHWQIWKADTALSVPALQRVATLVCEVLQVPPPTIVHDPSVGSSMGVYQPLDSTIRIGTRTSGAGISVTTMLHELAHHLCYKRAVPSTEENARMISITALFSVWPNKRGRPDIRYQEFEIRR